MKPQRIARIFTALPVTFVLAPALVAASDGSSLLREGLDLAKKGRTAEAQGRFRLAIEADSGCAAAWNDLAVADASRGELEAARDKLERALAVRPDISLLVRNLEKVRSRLARLAYDSAFGTVSPLGPLALEWDRDEGSEADLRLRAAVADSLSREVSSLREEVRRLSGVRETLSIREQEIAALRAEKARLPVSAQEQASRPAAPPALASRASTSPSVDPVRNSPPASRDRPAAVSGSRRGPEETVLAWADAWSRQDVDAYLSFYAPGFRPKGMDRASWEARRRERIQAPKSIRVDVQDRKLTTTSPHQAEVVYRQVYQTEDARLLSRKKIVLTLVDGDWKILEEKEAR